jgi:response regulator RpfG family c-di-GMP phosphodiesterase
MSTAAAAANATPAKATLLFVDDEPNILSALQRLFRPLGYRILTAPGGAAGLEILAREKVDLIISDMRMPEMDGATFLEQAAQRWPHVVRILLTGYADLGSAVAAVNKGNIYRYLSKPWEDNDIKITVAQALEKQRLELLVHRQNEELKALNASLEDKVRARTEELHQVLAQLETTHKELKKSFFNSVRVFAHLIELREGDLSGHARRVAEHARALALRLGMMEHEAQDVLYAALLHDIGKIGLPDRLINRAYVSLTTEERAAVAKHPSTGQAALLAVESLQDAALLIRSHHERYDGQGYPDRLQGEAIPLGARILAVSNDYDALQRGTIVEGRLSPGEARAFLIAHKASRYDPKVVDAFLALLEETGATALQAAEMRLSSDGLKPGMVLSRDLLNGKGMMLLPRGRELTGGLIAKIRAFEADEDRGYTIHVQTQ